MTADGTVQITGGSSILSIKAATWSTSHGFERAEFAFGRKLFYDKKVLVEDNADTILPPCLKLFVLQSAYC